MHITEQEPSSFSGPCLINVQWLLEDKANTFITLKPGNTRSNKCINRTQDRIARSKWLCNVAFILLSWRTCLRRGATARPHRWTQTSSAHTASRPAGSTVRPGTWWRTATAGWSTCQVRIREASNNHCLHYCKDTGVSSVWECFFCCQGLPKIRYFHTPVNWKNSTTSNLCFGNDYSRHFLPTFHV